MHGEAFQFIESVTPRGPFATVIEIGGRDINGTVRPLFGNANYLSIDLYEGPGVDIVTDAANWQPDEPVDCVVCAEVLEHAPNAEQLVRQAWEWLRPGGLLIVTCATDPRPAHSAITGCLIEPGDEFYANVPEATFREWCASFAACDVTINPDHGDLYAVAVK